MIEPRYLTKADLETYLRLGHTSVFKLLASMDKEVASGRLKPFRVYIMPGSTRCHYDRKVIDEYIERRGVIQL